MQTKNPLDVEAIQRRIAQFETMVRPEADPTNDMAWYSLGGAYAQAGRHADAANAYAQCVSLNPAMSKAWQLGGQALIDAGDRVKAVEVLTKGYSEAAKRGDRMPQKAMGDLLTSLGAALPVVESAAMTPGAGSGSFMCARSGKPGRQMTSAPFRGSVGAWIQQNISQETFDAWVRQGTKVINEMRLDLSRDGDQETYDKQMYDYLGIDDALLAKLRGEA